MNGQTNRKTICPHIYYRMQGIKISGYTTTCTCMCPFWSQDPTSIFNIEKDKLSINFENLVDLLLLNSRLGFRLNYDY